MLASGFVSGLCVLFLFYSCDKILVSYCGNLFRCFWKSTFDCLRSFFILRVARSCKYYSAWLIYSPCKEMDMSGKGSDVEPQSGSDDPVNYHEPSMSSEWQINGNNLTNTSIGIIPNANSTAVSSTCSSAPAVDSCCLPIWDQPSSGRSMGFCDVKVQNGASTSNSLCHVRGEDWTSNAMYGGGMFLPTVPSMLPQSLPHFPADSAFIERAARFSCFSGGNFGEMMNPYSIPDPLAPYSRGLGLMQGNESKPQPGVQSQQHEMNRVEVSKETLLHGKHGSEGSPYKNEKKGESFVQSYDEVKYGAGVSGNESDEAEFSGQEEMNGSAAESPGKGLGSKKRKRGGKGAEHDENNEAPRPCVDTAKDTTEIKHKGDQNPTSTSKPGVKHGKQVSDPPKEEYIHVRARRGQATNSHSLAERVRREKISERMKFLQDLVPGCSKVTGKAVMLDEIINYVQSLQRQVEFLSMKLATVNPQLDFNVEAFLAKDIPRPRAGLSSSLVFPPDMTVPFPPLHPSQPGLIQAGLLGNSSETLRRPINIQSPAACGGYKEPPSQTPSVWEDELRNVVHMGLNSSASHNSQDLNDSLRLGHMKAEP